MTYDAAFCCRFGAGRVIVYPDYISCNCKGALICDEPCLIHQDFDLTLVMTTWHEFTRVGACLASAAARVAVSLC